MQRAAFLGASSHISKAGKDLLENISVLIVMTTIGALVLLLFLLLRFFALVVVMGTRWMDIVSLIHGICNVLLLIPVVDGDDKGIILITIRECSTTSSTTGNRTSIPRMSTTTATTPTN